MTDVRPSRFSITSTGAALLALVVLGAAGCGSDDSASTDSLSAADLVGSTFVSTSTEGETLVDGTTISMNFEDGTVSTIAGCNTLFGGFTLENSALVAPTLASTQMACDDALTRQDQWIAELLQGSPTLTLRDGELTVASDSITVVLKES